jgi:hypothetical protein
MTHTIPYTEVNAVLVEALDVVRTFVAKNPESVIDVNISADQISLGTPEGNQLFLLWDEACPEGFEMMRMFVTTLYREMTGADPLDPELFLLYRERLVQGVAERALFTAFGLCTSDRLAYASLLTWEAAKNNLRYLTDEDRDNGASISGEHRLDLDFHDRVTPSLAVAS